MPKTVTRQVQVERRTYFRGKFVGKLAGTLDVAKSDRIHENFFDLDLLSAEMYTTPADIRKVQDGGEFEEFADVDEFHNRIISPLLCNVDYEDGSTKHFNISLWEPKFKDLRLHKQLYEKDGMFVTLEGQVSGYLRHFETEEIEVPIVDEPEVETAGAEVKISTASDALETVIGSGQTNPTGTVITSRDPLLESTCVPPVVTQSHPIEPFRNFVRFVSDSEAWSRAHNAAYKLSQRYPRSASWLTSSHLFQDGSRFLVDYTNGRANLSAGCAIFFIALLSGLIFVYAGLVFLWLIAATIALIATVIFSLLINLIGPTVVLLFLFFLHGRIDRRNKLIVKILMLFVIVFYLLLFNLRFNLR